MSALTSIGEFVWSALWVAIWLVATYMFLNVAWTGRFWTWRRSAEGRTWPPPRSEAPIKFWLLWVLLAGPFLLLTFFFLIGVAATIFGT